MIEKKIVKTTELQDFVAEVLHQNGLEKRQAEITADVLVSADQRGINSHGVARLKRYIDGLKDGTIRSNPSVRIVKETPVSLVIDGDGGMGQPVAFDAMTKCIEKAKQSFMCFASIRNSNHYGIAGYYTLMALKENLIGVSLTNTAPLVVPTFGKEVVIGTNPISIGVPAKDEKPFLLDMATSTVPRGKIEVYARKEEEIPDSWACNELGEPSTDASLILDNLINRRGGGLLPLGGGKELTGGHKGYGLSVAVDIFCSVLSSGLVGAEVYGQKGEPAGVTHFLGAISPEAFVGSDEVRENMTHYIRMLKNAEKAEGQARIYIHGEKEFEAEEQNREKIGLERVVFETLNLLGKPFGLILSNLSDK
ncbi:MAG: malate dehydrogenase [Candidatus Marinimicrobia bacterium CG08_land_8_20_14_0_20_45_22]|nr:MAG: malate dehydrogenase [Candidatus Marinimicrobia bacterium CG08_land_8_20_14_0_20_45_22]